MPFVTAVWMAVLCLWLLDASNNMAMEPYRAFIGDRLPSKQIAKGFLSQSLFIGAGSALAAGTLVVLEKTLAGATAAGIPYWVFGAFMVGSVCSIGSVLISVLSTKELPPTHEDLAELKQLTLITTNQDVRFDANIDKKTHALIDSPRTEQAKGFVTKVWNASRFVRMNLDGYVPGAPKAETPEDAWMLSRLARIVRESTEALEAYGFGDYARNIQSFFWNEVCD